MEANSPNLLSERWRSRKASGGIQSTSEDLRTRGDNDVLINFPGSLVINNLPAMQETRIWSLGQEDPLEKKMATHSSILAWRIPWTEKPSRLQSIGSQRTGQNWVTNTMIMSVQFSSVSQSCPILCNPMDCSPPGSSVHGILQARILEWIVIPFSRGISKPRDQTLVSCITGRFLTILDTGKSSFINTYYEKWNSTYWYNAYII